MSSHTQRIDSAAPTADSGLFIVHRLGEKLLFEIPDSILGREILLVSRLAQTTPNYLYGGVVQQSQTLRWQRNGSRVLLRAVSYDVVADDSLAIHAAVQHATFEPIVHVFPIEPSDEASPSVVIDVTPLFTTDVPLFGLPQRAREEFRVRNMDAGRSFVRWARSYPRNVEVRHVLTYNAQAPPSNHQVAGFSIEMHQSMLLLPKEPMRPRLLDDRIGYFASLQVDYGRSDQRVTTRRYIARWRLEPSDTAAFRRGELVEPQRPIVFYIDPATPLKWRNYLKQGVEDWSVAFERAGFRNAIRAADPPTAEDDPEWSPEDVRYSVIRWYPSELRVAAGGSVRDPRSGEILQASVGWFHNMLNRLRNWYFVQTAAANPEARAVILDDAVLGQLIRALTAHEVGHTLGLRHNMKSHWAIPVDSLRSPTFTCARGIASSIMDYAWVNYVAQPEDKGVCFVTRLGQYDKYAIMWGYRPILGASSADDERATLGGWIRDVADDVSYHFGENDGIDPTALSYALGNDAIRASEYGVANLRRVVPRLTEWSYREGEDYVELHELYEEVIVQWTRYMGHVVASVGGVIRTPRTYEEESPVYQFVPRATQQRAMQFLAQYAFQPPTWLMDEAVLDRIEGVGSVERMRALQIQVLETLVDADRMQRLIEIAARLGPAAYTLEHMLSDLRNSVWSELPSRSSIEIYRRNLHRGYLETIGSLMTTHSGSEVRFVVRGQMQTLQQELRRALERPPDQFTRLHLEDAAERVDRILKAEG